MHHFLLIFGFVLLPQVATLKCYECLSSEDCSGAVQTCPGSNNQCGAMRMISYAGSTEVGDFTTRACTDPASCINGSLNFGVSKTVVVSECCTSDLCNRRSVPVPPRSNPNGRKCYTCIGLSCNQNLNCEGSEDHCVTTTATLEGQSVTLKGCISKSFCAGNMQVKKNLGMAITCCQGDYCNSAGSISASLLLLVAPLIPLLTFS